MEEEILLLVRLSSSPLESFWLASLVSAMLGKGPRYALPCRIQLGDRGSFMPSLGSAIRHELKRVACLQVFERENTSLLFRLFTKDFVIYHDYERKRIAITSARTVRKSLTGCTQTKRKRIAITSARTVRKNLTERTAKQRQSTRNTIEMDKPIELHCATCAKNKKLTPEIKSFRTFFLSIF